jgi:hypothetical protein
MASLLFTLFVMTSLVVHCNADPKEAVLSLVERMDALYQKTRDGTGESNAQIRAMSNLRELARAAATPGVNEVFSSTVDTLSADVETKIKEAHSNTQVAINNAVIALEDATKNALALKDTADTADQTWFNCVRVEKSMLESVEHADKALAKSRSAVTEPCQEQEDKARFNWKAQEEDLAFECVISIHDNCDTQLVSYRSQMNSLVEELKEDVKEAGSEYAEAKQRCERARQDVVRKQSALDESKQTWQDQRKKCQGLHTQRSEAMCSFGNSLQTKCSNAAHYTSLVAEIKADGNNHSHPDRVEEWKMTHVTKCWLSKAAAGETLDEAALTSCVNSVNFDKDVGILDLKSEEVASLTSSENFTCSESTITFQGQLWDVPEEGADSSEYTTHDYHPKINFEDGSAPFAVCAEPPKTCGGTGLGSKCRFPFTYKGTTYFECTEADHSQPWCSINSKYRGLWGNCECN